MFGKQTLDISPKNIGLSWMCIFAHLLVSTFLWHFCVWWTLFDRQMFNKFFFQLSKKKLFHKFFFSVLKKNIFFFTLRIFSVFKVIFFSKNPRWRTPGGVRNPNHEIIGAVSMCDVACKIWRKSMKPLRSYCTNKFSDA